MNESNAMIIRNAYDAFAKGDEQREDRFWS
jgi:hypothetical protein